MNYNKNRFQNDNKKRKMMEDEMNRFESEIGGPPANYHQPPQLKPTMPAMFIPHQLQRQNIMPNHLLHTNTQPPPFLPSSVDHLARPPPIPTMAQPPPPINQTTTTNFKPIIQSSFIQHPINSSHTTGTNQQSTITGGQSTAAAKPSYTVTPMALPANVHNVSNPVQPSSSNKKQKTSDAAKNNANKKQKKIVRTAGGTTWEDPTLQEWGNDDFRIFCGDLGNDVNEDILTRAFNKYPSFIKCKVVRDKRTNKSRGYGFISFKEPADFIKAMRDMDGKYVGSRPIKLRRSTWKDRNIDVVKKKMKEKQKLGLI